MVKEKALRPPNTVTAPTSHQLGSKDRVTPPKVKLKTSSMSWEIPGVATLDVEGFPVSHLS